MIGRTNAEGNTLDMDLLTATPGDVASGKKFAGTGSDEIQTGTLSLSGSATDSQVLAKKTYYNTDLKNKRTGTMPVIPSKTEYLNCGASYTIPLGYHDGNSKVIANNLASQTSATLADSEALAGKTFWKDGIKRTGTMIDRASPSYTLGINGTLNLPAGRYTGGKVTQSIATMGAQTVNPGSASKTVSCSGKYMTGNITVNGDSQLKSSNIVDGVNIFGVTGNVLTADALFSLLNGIKMECMYELELDGGIYSISKNIVYTQAAENQSANIMLRCVQPNSSPFADHKDLTFKTTVSSYWQAWKHTSPYQMTFSHCSYIENDMILDENSIEGRTYTKTIETSYSPDIQCGVFDVHYSRGSGEVRVYVSVTKMEIFYKGILIKTYNARDFE